MDNEFICAGDGKTSPAFAGKLIEDDDVFSETLYHSPTGFNNVSAILETNSESLEIILNSNRVVERQFQLLKEEVAMLLKENMRLESEVSELKSRMSEFQQISRRRCKQLAGLSETETTRSVQMRKVIFKYLEIDEGQVIKSAPTQKKDGLKYAIKESSLKTTRCSDFHVPSKNNELATDGISLKSDECLTTKMDKQEEGDLLKRRRKMIDQDEWRRKNFSAKTDRQDLQRKELLFESSHLTSCSGVNVKKSIDSDKKNEVKNNNAMERENNKIEEE